MVVFLWGHLPVMSYNSYEFVFLWGIFFIVDQTFYSNYWGGGGTLFSIFSYIFWNMWGSAIFDIQHIAYYPPSLLEPWMAIFSPIFALKGKCFSKWEVFFLLEKWFWILIMAQLYYGNMWVNEIFDTQHIPIIPPPYWSLEWPYFHLVSH